MRTEPAAIISAVTAFLTAIIGLAVAFGIDISDEQQKAMLGVLAASVAIILVLGPVIRQFVYSPKTHADDVAKAHNAGAGGEALQVKT